MASVPGFAPLGVTPCISSPVPCVFGDDAVNYAGQVAFRALVPMANVPDSMKDPPFAMFVGPNRYFLHYPLRSLGPTSRALPGILHPSYKWGLRVAARRVGHRVPSRHCWMQRFAVNGSGSHRLNPAPTFHRCRDLAPKIHRP
jgi:hypothetical protein